MQINSSLDWDAVLTELRRQIGELSYNPDLWKMLNNIDDMVDDLSKNEVEARRKRSSKTEKQLQEINEAIDRLEKLLLMAALMR
jgi:predicted  nucleic acid-binding Zn-ribbon protein